VWRGASERLAEIVDHFDAMRLAEDHVHSLRIRDGDHIQSDWACRDRPPTAGCSHPRRADSACGDLRKVPYLESATAPMSILASPVDDQDITFPQRKETIVAVAKIIELTATSDESFEEAIRQAIAKANETVRNITGAWVKEQKVTVDGGRVTGFRVDLKVTFVLN
jgi:flavin-binding protein dodecin